MAPGTATSSDAAGHRGGVEALLLDQASSSGPSVYSAGRDATVKRWDIQRRWDGVSLHAPFYGHVDWVNDLAALGPALLTCSSDQTVKAWNKESAECLRTFTGHSDYVTCLGAAPGAHKFVSAGLRGEAFLWDGEAGAGKGLAKGGAAGPKEFCGKESVYSLAVGADANLVALGASDNVVRLWDPRQWDRDSAQLKGHMDNVRALALSASGKLLLSGSSDNTIRLWDLGQQRCIQTFAVHTDSVWALIFNEDEGLIYSGGKDGCVYRTHVATKLSELLFADENPVTSLAANGAMSKVWTASAGKSSAIKCWGVPGPEDRAGERLGRTSFVASTSPVIRYRMSKKGFKDPRPLIEAPDLVVVGAPGIIKKEVLNDRTHVLTQDSEGAVVKWSVLTGGVAKDYGPGDFEAILEQVQPQVSVASWFSVDCKMGVLTILLQSPKCFACEVYARDFIPGANEELKMNIGQQFLRALLQSWVERCDRDLLPKSEVWKGVLQQPVFSYADCDPETSVFSETDAGEPWRLPVHTFTGKETTATLPAWAIDAVHSGPIPAGPVSKLSFHLHPAEGSDLPALKQGKLTAPRILSVRKVKTFVVSKLEDVMSKAEMFSGGRDKDDKGELKLALKAADVEIFCKDKLMGDELSLATIKTYHWKRSDDIVFEYRRKVGAVEGEPPSEG